MSFLVLPCKTCNESVRSACQSLRECVVSTVEEKKRHHLANLNMQKSMVINGMHRYREELARKGLPGHGREALEIIFLMCSAPKVCTCAFTLLLR